MADVSVKMGVSGVAQFKQGMKDAEASVKTLDAALKANEKAFKASGDAENHLAAQTTLLNQKLQQQKTIVKNAEQALKQMEANGVRTTSAAYQNMQRRLIEAQSGMMDTQASLDNLGASAVDAAGKADNLSNSLGGLNKKVSLDQVISVTEKLTSGLENAAKKAVRLGEDLWNRIMDSARWADDTATMAQMYGIDVDTFQRMQKLVTNGLDTSVEAILKSQSKFKKGIGDGTKAVTEAMNELGLTTREWQTVAGESGSALMPKDATELFWEAGRAIMNLGDEFEKESKAQALFGKSWHELVPLFSEYKTLDEYNAALAEQNVVSEESVKSLAELNDEVSKLIGDFETLKTETIGSLAPALTKGAEALDGLLSRVLEYLETPDGQKALEDLGTAVEGLFSDLGSIDPESVVQGFSDVFNKIVGGVQWIVEKKDAVVTALEGIVIGWGTLKLTGGALDILKLIQGISGLAGGGAAAAAGEAGAAAGASWGGAFANAVLAAAPWLIGLYTLLNPAGTAGDNIDKNVVNGQVTEAGIEFWNNNPDQWNKRQTAVANRYGDLAGIMGNSAALNIMLNTELDDEQMFAQLEEKLGLQPVDVNVEPVVGDDAAAAISEQIGTVIINGEVHLVDAEGNDVGDLSDWTGELVTPGHGKRRKKSNANGIWSVPFDGYQTVLHKGERVVPAREVYSSRNFSSNLYVESMYMNNGTDAAGLAAAMAAAQKRTMSGYGS